MPAQEISNPTYRKIRSLDLDLELKQGRAYIDRIYLIDTDGVRIAQSDYSNNRKPSTDVQDFATTLQGSHKDKAMKDVLNTYEQSLVRQRPLTMEERWAQQPSRSATTASKTTHHNTMKL